MIYLDYLVFKMDVIKDLLLMKSKNLSIFVNRGLYSLNKDEIPNVPPNSTYFERKIDLMQGIIKRISYTNI